MRARKKKWTTPYIESIPELVVTSIDKDNDFYKTNTLYLEIGMGKGDFIIGMAKKQPGHYLGVEKVLDVLAIAAKKIKEEELDNILLRLGDFDQVYEEIKDLRFEKIYLNFSDPWPKKKHWRRRLSERERLKKMANLLTDSPTSYIVMKTDNDGLYEYSKIEAIEAGLDIVADQFDYVYDEVNDSMSEYEANFRSKNQKIHRLVFSKKGGK